MFQSLELKDVGLVGFGGNQKGRIRGSGTIGNGSLLSISDVLYVEGLMHNLLSISQLSDNELEITVAGSDEKAKESEEAEKGTLGAPEVTVNQKRSRNRQIISEELIMGNKNKPIRTRSTFKGSEETLLGLVSLIEPTSCEESTLRQRMDSGNGRRT
ncbi:hypothetical protein KIW84_044752 [Lathyrus oleraceus]|uniref:Retrovirus-related Pol polyprotein from transposon TNT 1-94-like beta-barrel domain-containing protein n=1 Tax=Pisum sativum TaxID=3888 RepID=A0A9D4XH17_PEA|nr:hypothetical protein KIW84_044752 [Pisum sativum]